MKEKSLTKTIAGIAIAILLILAITPQIFTLWSFIPDANATNPISLAEAYQVIKQKPIVDLTHAFAPDIPHWQGFPNSTRETLYSYEPSEEIGSGFWTEKFCHVGQWGTHIDPPAHFIAGLRTVDQIQPAEMILPLVVIDIHQAVEADPDYTVTLDDIQAWEDRHGKIPSDAFVALRTDWSKLWPDAAAMQNLDSTGVAHYPGWSLPVLEYLYQQRQITASGHETTDTDPGVAVSGGDFSLEKYVLEHNHYQIELLANLDQVPESGAVALVTFPKPANGSGFPARVLAILP